MMAIRSSSGHDDSTENQSSSFPIEDGIADSKHHPCLAKLSPDCVANITHNEILDCRLILPCVSSSTDFPTKEDSKLTVKPTCDYNLPPLQTPQPSKRIAPSLLLLKENSILPRLPLGGTSILEQSSQTDRESLSSPRCLHLPRIAKPIPLSGTSRRTQSDNLCQAKSSERRSIFGQYFEQKKQHPLQRQPQAQCKKDRKGISENVTATVQQERRYKISSSPSILSMPTFVQPRVMIDYRMFAPPTEHAHQSAICGRFHSVDDKHIAQDLERMALPPLPSPLQRFCSSSECATRRREKDGDLCQIEEGPRTRKSPRRSFGSGGGGMHGMYPLMTPVSILRQSSYCRTSSPLGNDGSCRANIDDESVKFLNSSFNLTQSSRKLTSVGDISPFERKNHLFLRRNTSSTSSESTLSMRSIQRRTNIGVCFDPRVTVTEFEDAVERIWYDDVELERFKRETIQLAREYMLENPSQAEKYNRAVLDPVTKTYRKRALFSLPVLNSDGVEDDDTARNESDVLSSNKLLSLWDVTMDQVKRILVVDPSPSILALFCKSMISMFPSAKVETAQSAERALSLVKSSLEVRGKKNLSLKGDHLLPPAYRLRKEIQFFDIIIIEQCLYPASPHEDSSKQTSALAPDSLKFDSGSLHFSPSPSHGPCEFPSISSLPDVKNQCEIDPSCYTKPGSSLYHDIDAKGKRKNRPERRLGSDLTRAIVGLERETTTKRNFPISPDGNGAEAFEWKVLLIGVSMHPDLDEKLMQEAGSDLVWGKPIPQVGAALRNELLKALLAKRQRSSS